MSDEFDIEERHTVLVEIGLLRGQIEALHATVRGTDGRVERLGVEQGRTNSFLTAHTVRADVEDTQQEPLNGLAGKTVLVADNEPVILKYLRRGLEKRGARVLPANSVDEALSAVRRNRIHAALVDLRIPLVEDGMHIARSICVLQPEAGVVIMSGLLEAPGLDALPVARLPKPFGLEQLEHTLCEAIGAGGPSFRSTVHPEFDRESPTQPGSRLVRPSDLPPGTELPSTADESPDAKRG